MEEKMVVLSEADKSALIGAIKNLSSANKVIYDLVEEGTLTEEMSGVMVACLEGYFVDIAKNLKYESKLLADEKMRHIRIRKANQKVRELQEKLGLSKPLDGVPELLTRLNDTVSDWWDIEGFHYVNNQSFTPYGKLNLTFNFMLDGRDKAESRDGYRSNSEHFKHLCDMGFEFDGSEKRKLSGENLLDNQKNRTLLIAMIRGRFPSVRINNIENHRCGEKPDAFFIRSINATICNLNDI